MMVAVILIEAGVMVIDTAEASTGGLGDRRGDGGLVRVAHVRHVARSNQLPTTCTRTLLAATARAVVREGRWWWWWWW